MPDEPRNPPSRGQTRKLLARWLTSEVGEGNTFTIMQAELMVFAATGVKRVEVDRRIRELREARWIISNYRTDASLKAHEHRLVKIGDDINHPTYQWPRARRCPGFVRRYVMIRDARTCQICGLRSGEIYPDDPGFAARMTIGRLLPGSRGGSYTIENCRVECSRCNEEVQDRYDYGGEILPPAA
jgi:5-methylcytosine-specific restriction endonuclease McrA